MPRKKKVLSRGSSPEKAVGSDFSSSAGQYGQSYLTNPSSAWAMAWQSSSNGGQNNNGQNHDQTFQQVQDMFEGKVEGEVVYMVLQECDWKVDEAVDKLCMLTPVIDRTDSPLLQQAPQLFPNMAYSNNGRISSRDSQATMGPTSLQPDVSSRMLPDVSHYPDVTLAEGRLDRNSDLSSRLPPVSLGSISTAADGLPMLSPKTPAIASLDFPFPHGVSNAPGESSLKSAMEALDSYANNMTAPGYQHQQSFTGHLFNFNNRDIEPSSGMSRTQGSNGSQISSPYQEQSSQGLKMDPRDSVSYFSVSEGSPFASRNPGDFTDASGNSSQVVGASVFSSRSRSLSPQSVLKNQSEMRQSVGSRQSSRESNAASGNEEGNFRIQMAHRQGSTSSSGTPSSANSLQSPLFTKAIVPVPSFIPEGDSQALPSSPQLTPITGHTERSLSSDSQPEGKETEKRNPMQILRHQNISLDPTERENLEKLIEEVIIGGIGEGVLNYSDDSSSEDEESLPTVSDPSSKKVEKPTAFKSEGSDLKARVKKELEALVADGTAIPQSNLKVAAKHMKNLPPRFLKRLQAVNADDGEEETDDTSPERPDTPGGEQVELKKKGESKKKKKRELLKGLDVFMDEQGVKVLELGPSTEEVPGEDSQEQLQVRKSPLFVSQETLDDPVPVVNVKEEFSSEQADENKMDYLGSNLYEEARASPKVGDGVSKSGTNTPKSSLTNPNIILRQDAVNCEELEKELMKITGQARESPRPYQPRPRHPAILTEPPKVNRITKKKKVPTATLR